MNKTDIRDAIIDQLQRELAQQTAAAHLARDEAISEESRPENKYDTHSQEAAYLAGAQAKLAQELADTIALYLALPLPATSSDAAVEIGRLVEVDTPRSPTRYFIGPRAGGVEVTSGGKTILVITPQSPVGRALLGKRQGDAVRLPGRSDSVAISAVW